MHTPVLVPEVVEFLRPRPGQRMIDGTVGLGGHALALLPRLLPGGRLLGIDCDETALSAAAERLSKYRGHFDLAYGNFRDLPAVAAREGYSAADGILLDLGVSSAQLDASERGFSFAAEGPLDMRLDPSQRTTAATLLRRASARELERIFREYGDERYARRIARAVAAERGRLRTTTDLARLIERVVPTRERRIHPATRCFLALRVATNDELGALEAALDAAPGLLAPGARMAVISFHSHEDRLVKHRFRDQARAGVMSVVTRKPVRPSAEEVSRNRRSRSAKLRVAERATA
ncbi:MAG: 16S rRNA (cytosine(1402)-N(4))-methyltransferase RsmH [Planctomycetota bacterium]